MSKSSKWRACPALGRDITPAECGAQRQSRLACPESCPHNPFARDKYSQLLEIEKRLDQQTVAHIPALELDPAVFGLNLNARERKILGAETSHFTWGFFFSKDATGLTTAQRWEKSGFPGLKNDEQVLLRGKMQIRMALLEVHRVFADGLLEAVDLLSAAPEPLIFQDRSLAAAASRFSTYLTWVYPLPHYWRLFGSGLLIPDMASFTAPEIVREILRHLGGPPGEAELRLWLAEHFVRFYDALHAVGQLRRRQMFANLDAKYGKVVYELRAPFAECREQLDSALELDVDDLSGPELDEGFAEARVWFDGPPKSKQLTTPEGQMTLGRVLLGQSHWRLETFGLEKIGRLRQQFEALLGDRVRFQGERIDDLGARISAKEPEVDETLVPPRLLENVDRVLMGASRIPVKQPGMSQLKFEEEMRRENDRIFLDERIPALENHTPREAARDLLLRPILVQLMKRRVRGHDEHKLKTGSPPDAAAEDVNWMLRELELNELIFDPPPSRPPPASSLEEPGDFPELDEMYEPPPADPNRPPAPPLPDGPLEIDEAAKRLQAAVDSFETAREAEDELYASGSTIVEDADELTLEMLTEVDFGFAVPFIMQAWLALCPPGYRAPVVPFANLEKTFGSNLFKFLDSTEAPTPKKLEKFFLGGVQPNLLLILMDTVLQSADAADKNIRPRAEALPVILALLKTIVEELDGTLRQKW